MLRRPKIAGLTADLLRSLILFAMCYLTARAALGLGVREQFAVLIWLPTGISLAALTLWGRHLWPAVFLAAWCAQIGSPVAPLAAFGIAVANAAEALVGAWLLQHFKCRPALSRMHDVMVLIVGGAIGSTFVSVAIGLGSMWLTGDAPTSELLGRGMAWWTNNAVSDLIIAPAILVWSSRKWPAQVASGQRALEVFGFVAMALVVFGLVYKGCFLTLDDQYRIFEPYLLAPIMVWSALRFGQHGTTATVLAVTSLGALVSLHGQGPITGSSALDNLIYIEILATFAAVAMMVLAAAIEEQAEALLSLRKSEQLLRQAKDEAEGANRSKSLFLAKVSHEIRTPLGAMLGFTDFLLEEGHSPAERTTFIRTIKRNGELLARIIDDILDLSKVEADRLDIETLPLQLADLLSDIHSLLSFKAGEKGLSLSVFSDGPMPRVVTTDPTRLRQILINVLGNAVKFTQRGQVEVRIKLQPKEDKPPALPQSAGSRYLEFHVRDTGPGLTLQQAQRLFQPFSQADNSMTRRYGGTGLGLFLAHKLAKALGGDLRLLASAPGQGSTFLFRLPVLDCDCVDLVAYPPASQPVQPVVATPSPTTSLKDIRILLIDDSFDNRALIGRVLNYAGGVVEVADNGREGIAKAEHDQPDVILMDIQMPEIDGYAAMSELRQHGYAKPIIALTAHAMKEERERALREGFDDYLTKPVLRDLMIATIAKWAAHKTRPLALA